MLRLEDGSTLVVTEREILSFGLYSGIELEEERISALKAAAEAELTFARAAGILARRALSRRDLIRKLREKGSTPADAELAADRLEKLGVLDDKAYAAALVRRYSERGWGENKLRDELYRRGIDKEIREQALSEAPPPEDSIDALLEQRLRGTDPDGKDLRRAADMLYRRGYSWEDIEAAVHRYRESRE